MIDQDQIPTLPVRELTNKRRREDIIVSHTLLLLIALDVMLRIVEIIAGH